MDDKPLQDQIEEAMPPNFGYDVDAPEPEDGELRATHDEMRSIQEAYRGLTQTFLNRGFTQNEIRIPLQSVEHSVNAGRFDPYEYDRIAFSIELKDFVESWRDDQDKEIPPGELAMALDWLTEYYRTEQRRQIESGDDEEDET